MLIRFAFRRIARHWHLLLVPLLGVCTATGLFALAPLYSRAVTELGIRYAMETEKHQRVNIRVMDSQPLDETVFAQGVRHLGDLYEYKTDVAFAPPTATFQGRIAEYDQRGERQENGWFFYSFSELEDHTRLVSGRWPRPQLPFFVPSVGGLRVDAGLDPGGRLAVHRASADFEAVVTSQVARESGRIRPGSLVRFGPGEFDPIVRVVGIITPTDRGEAYWMADSQPLDGALVSPPLSGPIFFGSLFVSRPVMERLVDGIEDTPTLKDDLKIQPGEIESNQAFRRWSSALKRQELSPEAFDKVYAEAQRLGFASARALADVKYGWYIALDRDAVTASTMADSAQSVLRMGETITGEMPDAQVITALVSIIRVFLEQIRAVQAPVTFLTAGILTLVLYYMLTTTSLALGQQGSEWATVRSRGGSTGQLLFFHGVTVLLQCLIGFAVSLPVAQGLLFVLRRVGPLAELAVGPTLHIPAPPEVWSYAAIASLASAVALMIPAVPAARRTIITLQMAIARPPRRPVWSRYALDVVLLLLGAALLWRAERLGDLRTQTFTGQTTLDAMTVLAPLLVLAGGALLWLRVYPWLMRLLGRLAARQRGLAAPLAFWGISRNPGHFAQLVLLLLGSFGLGAMAASLRATRDTAAWRQAQFDTGSTVRVELEEKVDAGATAWADLPGTTAASLIFRGYTGQKGRVDTLQLIGIDPETVTEVTPLDPSLLEPLAAGPPGNLSGIALPEDLAGLSLWARHRTDAEDAELWFWAVIADRWGHRLALELEGDSMAKEGWTRWQSFIPPTSGRPPWRLVAIALESKRGSAGIVEGEITVDDIEAILPDGTLIPVEALDDGATDWSEARGDDPMQPAGVEWSSELAHTGDGALVLSYRAMETARYGTQPFGAWINRPEMAPIPVLIEAKWAEHRRYKVGDPLRVEVTLGEPHDIRGQRILCEIVGIMEAFPTLGDSPNPFVVGSLHQLLPAINAGAASWPLEPNEVWLSGQEYEPSQELLEEFSQPGSGVAAVHTASELREALRREPLPNAFAGILYGGFWVALALSLVGLGFYLMLTARRRMVSFGVLSALGWTSRDLWRLLVYEQLALATPAVIVGLALGTELTRVISAFIPLFTEVDLAIPLGDLAGMVAGLGAGVAFLLLLTGRWLRKQQLARMLRLGGE